MYVKIKFIYGLMCVEYACMLFFVVDESIYVEWWYKEQCILFEIM
jgi:hypothetical protein